MSLEYLSHEKLCHWNNCHMKIMSLEYLSHKKLCHWNTCHMNSYVTGTFVTFIHLAKKISGSKNAVQVTTLKSSAQYHMTPTRLARKQMTAAANMLF